MYEVNSAFARVEQILPFFHILSISAIIALQTSVIAIVIFFMKSSQDKKNLKFLLFSLNLFFFLFILLLALIVTIGYLLLDSNNIKFADPMVEEIINTKIVLILFILFNHFYIFYRMKELKKSILKDDNEAMMEHLVIIAKYFLPLNIALFAIGIYLGVALKVI